MLMPEDFKVQYRTLTAQYSTLNFTSPLSQSAMTNGEIELSSFYAKICDRQCQVDDSTQRRQ